MTPLGEDNFTRGIEVTGDFSEAATFIPQKIAPVLIIPFKPEVAKILTKILPQFGIYALVMGLHKF
jgi:hypothetical protein